MLRFFFFFGKWICFRHEKKRINMFEEKYINFRLLPMAKRFGSRFKSADTRVSREEKENNKAISLSGPFPTSDHEKIFLFWFSHLIFSRTRMPSGYSSTYDWWYYSGNRVEWSRQFWNHFLLEPPQIEILHTQYFVTVSPPFSVLAINSRKKRKEKKEKNSHRRSPEPKLGFKTVLGWNAQEGAAKLPPKKPHILRFPEKKKKL